MELTTFGEALKYGIHLETTAQEIFETLCAANAGLKDLFLSFASGNKKRKTFLENQYREAIYSDQDTGIFEPLAGLKGADDPQGAGGEDKPCVGIAQALENEEKAKKFYLDFAAVVKSRRRGMGKKFEEMAKENSDRQGKLKSIQMVDV